MTKKRIKQGSALILAAALALSAFVLPQVYAAGPVDTTKTDCSVEIDVTGTAYKELNGSDAEVTAYPVTIDLYKVADINVSGKYKAVSTLGGLDFSDVDKDTTAAEWEALAADAKAAVEKAEMAVTASGTTENGKVTISGLAVGLYLVDAQQVLSDYYQYDFTPYLISLPNNYYYDTADDGWVYDLTGEHRIGLKPAKSDRYGNLEITKILDTYGASTDGATFIFQIEGYKTDVDTGEVRWTISEVESLTFHSAGSDTVTVEHIPAGTEVTVTEIITGASYTVKPGTSDLDADGNAYEDTIILADGADGSPAGVTFENTFEEGLNGGSGLVNHFAYNSETGEWTHAATEDSTSAE